MQTKPVLNVAFADMWDGFPARRMPIFLMLTSRFQVNIDEQDPDLVFCGPFRHWPSNRFSALTFSCPRVFWTGEATAPDFELYDYALGYDRIEFPDRYLRLPLYVNNQFSLNLARRKHTLPDSYFTGRQGFCSCLVSNGAYNVSSGRDDFFRALDARRHVDSGGQWLNNMGGTQVADEIEFRRGYRFGLCWENIVYDGYVTEKIVDTWASGAIPIYNGGNGIEAEFNPRAFINVSDYASWDECINHILWLDDHPDEWLKIAKEPIYADEAQARAGDFETKYLDFIENIMARPRQARLRRSSALSYVSTSHENYLRARR